MFPIFVLIRPKGLGIGLKPFLSPLGLDPMPELCMFQSNAM